MRQKMRQAFDELWIIDLEGDQHGARKTENVFAIQTPVAVAIGVRYGGPHPTVPAKVRYAKITGTREEKYSALNAIRSFQEMDWRDCFQEWTKPFLPQGEGDYFSWPLLADIFPWQYSGVQFKRTWPIGETQELLQARWAALLATTGESRRIAFKETDRSIDRRYPSLDGSQPRLPSISSLPADAAPVPPTRYAFRSFDRQWALADPRLADRIRPPLWHAHSAAQIYLTSILADVLGLGPAATITPFVPDLHHFSGRGGKDVIPLFRDREATQPNITNNLLDALGAVLGVQVCAADLLSYVFAVLAGPAYVARFSEELTIPGPRLPITRNAQLFTRGVALGRRLIRLQTFGQRFVPEGGDPGEVPQGQARCRRGIPTSPDEYPSSFSYDAQSSTLYVGNGVFSEVANNIWTFSVSGLEILRSWLSYRMKAGAGRASSPLDEIRPSVWTGQMTQELLELIWVLEGTVAMYPELTVLLDEITSGETFRASELPTPTEDERSAPTAEEPEPPQQEIGLES